MSDFFLIITGMSFSFFCAVLKQTYVNVQYANMFTLLIDIFVSGFAGLIIACVLSEYFHSPLAFIGLCGAGGLGGAQALQYLMTRKIITKVTLDGEENDEELEDINLYENKNDLQDLIDEAMDREVDENNQQFLEEQYTKENENGSNEDAHNDASNKEDFHVKLDDEHSKIKIVHK